MNLFQRLGLVTVIFCVFAMRLSAACSSDISPATLSSGTVGVSYKTTLSFTPVTTAPYTWTISAGSLPSGLNLTQDKSEVATIDGTPDKEGTYNFTMKASDGAGCTVARDYTLVITTVRCPTLTIDPASLPDGTVKISYGEKLTVTKSAGPYTWSIVAGSLPPGLELAQDKTEVAVVQGTPTTDGVFRFTVGVSDANGCTATRDYSVQICPLLTISPSALADGTLNAPYGDSMSVTLSKGPYTWSTTSLPPGLKLTSDGTEKAVIEGTPTRLGSFSFTVTVMDGNGCSTTRTYSISVTCPTSTISPAALADGTQNTTYSAPVSVTSTTAPYTWSISAGALPSGLKLTSDTTERAVIEGTPTTLGSFTFTLKVTDANGCSASRDYTVRINCPTLTISPTSLADGSVKVAYSAALSVTTTQKPYSWGLSAGSLPAGLKLTTDGSEGAVIEGTPTTEGSFSFTMKVADGAGCSTTRDYTIRIASEACPTLTIDPSKLADAIVNDAYSAALSVTSTKGPYTWGIASGALPAGLKLTTDTTERAAIEGTPTREGTFAFTVKVVDGAGCSTARDYSITVGSKSCTLALTTLALGDGSVKIAYSAGLAVNTTQSPYSWGVSAGSLPPGLRLNAGTTERAVIEGTPTTEGSYSFTIKVADGAGCVTTRDYTIRIAGESCGTLTITPSTLSSGGLNAPYSATLVVTSTKAPYTWSVSSGSLPPGLKLSSDGSEKAVLEGTPTTEGFYTFTIKVGDGGGCTAARDYTLTIAGRCTITPAPTTLVAPNNGATGITPPVLFQWSKVSNAATYRLYVAINGKGFELYGETDGTSLERIVPAGAIEWFVVTTFADCPEQKSSSFRFTIDETAKCADGSVTLQSPRDGQTVNSPAILSWTGVTGTSFYRVWIALNGGAPAVLARTTDTTASLALPSGKVEWYVEAVPSSTSCPSIISPHATFSVTAATSCDGNAPVTIEAPVPSSGGQPPEETSPVDLRWRKSDRARGYRVWIAMNGQPFEDIGYTTDIHLLRELKPGKYEWYVDAFYESCPTVPSSHGFFVVVTTTPRCTSSNATLLSPAEGASATSPVTFIWNGVSGATGFRVFAAIDSGDFALLDTTTDTSITRSMPPGVITWYVETTFDSCPSTFSSKSRFSVARASDCDPNAQTQLVSPPDGAANVPSLVTFDWNALAGATSYTLVAKFGDDAATTLDETKDTTVQKYMPLGTIEWWVIALRAGCPPVESKHFRFTTSNPEQCSTRRPTLVSPADGATNLRSPVTLAWTGVQGATYTVWGEVNEGGLAPLATTDATKVEVELPDGKIRWFVEAAFSKCPSTASADGTFSVARPAAKCTIPEAPVISVPGQVVADTAYNVRWSAIGSSSIFELQEATKPDFSDATTKLVEDLSASFQHTATDRPVQYLYRVRAISTCSDDRGPYSNVIGIFIIPPAAKKNASAEIGTPTQVIQTIFIPGTATSVAFTARSDQAWVRITPSSGIVPPEGITLTITGDPTLLAPGTNTATVIIEYAESGKNGAALGSRTTSTSVSVSLVPPVSSKGKNSPLPESLIIPAVAHTPGANGSLFESDIRVANTSAQPMKYQVFFTPSGNDGTQTGSTTTIQVGPGETMALDDVLAAVFGNGNDGRGATGMMEIRPLTASTSSVGGSSSGRGRATVASSRTYNVTESGTFGQFIPAISYSQFIGKSDTATKAVLSLQQISQSAKYRTNFGLVEASGEPVSVMFSVYDGSNRKVAEFPLGLQASEHRQFNGLLAERGITLTDGRVEVEVTSPTGRVSAYASVVDNRTNDPMLVSPVLRNAAPRSSRVVLPSIGDFDIGIAHWKSDVRVFNAGTAATPVTLSYYPQGKAGTPSTITTTLQAGEVRTFDNFIEANFGTKTTAGSLVITTPQPANIVATAKTYTDTANGTYGQFIPGVTPEESIGMGAPALQILQLEQSTRFRTNIGVAETSGKPAVAEISVIVPGSKATPRIQIPLAANEFRQISLLDFQVGTVYNVRATVKVMSGTGRVTAYGSLIDQVTQDPTYVPAQ